MMLVSTISYIDRNTLALLAPTILAATGLNNEQYGYAITAFSIAYMLGNPIWGRILDRIGLRKGMTAAVTLWTIASAAHAFVFRFRGFAVARAILGFGEGATFPGGLRTVTQTLAPNERARGIAIAYSGGSLGALITPLLVTPINAHFGWRGAFLFTGAVGAAWLAMWAILARRKDLATPPPAARAEGPAPRWSDARLWGFLVAYSLGAFPSAFVLYQASIYLHAVFGKTQDELGRVLWIPPLGWELGYFFWGWVTDRFCGAGSSTVAMRRNFLFLMLASVPLALVPRAPTYQLTLAMLFVSMFITAGFIIGAVAYATSFYSTGHAGLIAGLGAGSWSAVVGAVMPGIGHLFDLHRYGAAFLLATAFPIAGYLAWRLIDSYRGARASAPA
jgi:ACS family hexuronate transporter-like MFS transporter